MLGGEPRPVVDPLSVELDDSRSNFVRGIPPRPLPNSSLIGASPIDSGFGRNTIDLWNLGFFQDLVIYPARRGTSDVGYPRVVRARCNFGGVSTFASSYFPSIWSRDVRKWKYVHFFSPHFFHLVKYNRNATGMVHDMDYAQLDFPLGGPRGYRALMRRNMHFVRQLRAVVVNSAVTQTELATHFPAVESTVIHHWTSYEFRARDKQEARVRLGLPLKKTLLLSVGGDLPRKNLSILPRIVQRLGPEYALIRIGEGSSIRKRMDQATLIESSRVPRDVYPLYFNAADALLMPSIAEGFGVPIIEAVNSELPAVVSRIDTFREVLGSEYPFFAAPDSVNEWVDTCSAALLLNDKGAAEQSCYDQLRGYYRPERASSDYSRFFQRLGLCET